MNKFPELTKFSHLLASFFGIGLLPVAPGTWGSLAGLLLFFSFIYFQLSYLLFVSLFLCFVILAIVACSFASKDIAEKDHKAIVIDEVAGAWLSFLFIPVLEFMTFHLQNGKESYLAAFFLFGLFRFFDIFKPHPIIY